MYEVDGHTRDYWNWLEAEQEMPAYRKVRQDLLAGKLDVIHCVDADRLGRDPALIQQFYSLAERCNCEVYDASMPHPLGQQSVGHRYGVAVKSVGAGEDQRRRVARYRMGMRGRVKRGLHPGIWPLGYTPIRRGRNVIGAKFNDDIGAVKLMTKLFLDGLSFERIAVALQATSYRMPRGGDWSSVTVRRILLSEVYAGYVNWAGVRNPEPSDRFPHLWDEETFAAIQRERERRHKRYSHPKAGPFSGIAYCQRCGGRMGRAEIYSQPGHYYLRCAYHAHGGWRRQRAKCHANNTPEADVIAFLSEWLSQFTDPQAIDEALAQETGLGNLEEELAQVDKQLAELEPKRLRLALAYADSKMTAAIYHEADAALLAQQDTAEMRRVDLQAKIAQRPSVEERRQGIERLLARGLDLQSWPPEVLGPALRRAGVRVYIEDHEVQFCAFAL